MSVSGSADPAGRGMDPGSPLGKAFINALYPGRTHFRDEDEPTETDWGTVGRWMQDAPDGAS